MLQNRTAVFSVLFALLISAYTSTCATIGHKKFQITTEIISPTRVRLSWESGSEVEGNKASRFRVLCSSPDSAPIEAIATTTVVEMDTFTPGVEYTCEVHPVWDDLFEGMEVISANPGISQPFVMEFKEQTASSMFPSTYLIMPALTSPKISATRTHKREDSEFPHNETLDELTSIKIV